MVGGCGWIFVTFSLFGVVHVSTALPRPKGFWPFNREYGLRDISGHDNHGSLGANAYLGENLTGPYGIDEGSYALDQCSECYIEIPNNGQLTVQSYTVAGWIYPQPFTGGITNGPLFHYKGTQSEYRGLQLLIQNNGLDLRIAQRTSTDGLAGALTASGVTSLNEWQHVSSTYDYSSGLIVNYVNFQNVGTEDIGPNYSPTAYTSGPIRLGARTLSNINYARGRWTCWMVFDQALTATELKIAADLCKPFGTNNAVNLPVPEPVGMWHFNEELQGKDLSGYQNHPTLNEVTAILGPNGENTAKKFSGSSSSYIRIPNNGALDVTSYTVLMQVKPGTVVGPLFQWFWDGAGSDWNTILWMYNAPNSFYYWATDDSTNTDDVTITIADVFTSDEWAQVAVTYNYTTGETVMWKNGMVLDRRIFGSIDQRLSNDVLIALSISSGDTRYWDGSIACYQLYDRTLNQAELLEAQELCTKHGMSHKKESKFVRVNETGFGFNISYVKTSRYAVSVLECHRFCLHEVTCHLINFLPNEKLCEMSDNKYETLTSADFIDRGAGCKMYKRMLI